ncbi:MAG: hypothetical protein ACT4OZ_17425 [Gemmatimonadota bacterium]
MSYRELDAGLIVATLDRLSQRIDERFPGAGLGRVCDELIGLARDSAGEAESLGRPNWPVRVAVAILATLMVLLPAWAAAHLSRAVAAGEQVGGVTDILQAAEAVINEVLLLGAAIYFLSTAESRLKRRRALRRLHELRSIAHIVDMHQLTKDSEQLSPSPPTPEPGERLMSREDLGRYLDYCSELLSLCGKVAALYVQRFNDSLVLQSVNEIEDLTNGLSRKIWQKITLLER